MSIYACNCAYGSVEQYWGRAFPKNTTRGVSCSFDKFEIAVTHLFLVMSCEQEISFKKIIGVDFGNMQNNMILSQKLDIFCT